jgi:hypothetical protein
MPGTFNRSSTLLKDPFFVRYAMIAFAVLGPTPVSESSSLADAELRLINRVG